MTKYQVGQSHNHDEMYVKIGEGGVTDHGALTGLEDNDHPQYLLTTGKAADADKLDGKDSTEFVDTTTNQTVQGTKTFTVLPLLPATTPGTNNPVRREYADATYVRLSMNETIAGVKTFSSIPILPASNPTLANHAVRKGYVDTLGTWVTYSPTFTGWASATVQGTFKYTALGKLIILLIDISAGTSNATNALITLPVNAALTSSYGGVNGMAMDNSVVLSQATKWYIGYNENTIIQFGTNMGTGLWTASGTKRVRCIAMYEAV